MKPVLVNKLKLLKQNTTIRNGILFSIFSFFNSGVSFILLVILAKYISPADYGYLNLFNTFVTLINIFISLSTVSFISVAFFKKDRVGLLKVIDVTLLVSSVVLVVLFFTLSVFPVFFEKLVGIKIYYQWFALLICYFQVFNSVNLDIWRLEEKPVSYGLYSVSTVLLNFVITLFLIIGLDQGWVGRVYSQFYVSFVFFFISILFLIKRKYILFKWPEYSFFKETILYALPIIPHLTSFWLRQGLDRYIINYYYSTSEVGLFSFALNFASIISIVGTAFNATSSVFIYKKLTEGYGVARNILERQTRLMFVFFAILTIAVIGVVTIAIPWVLPKYIGCIPFLLPVCIAAFFYCIYLLYVNYLFYYERTVLLMWITFSMSVLQVSLSLLLTKYSILYTAYISLFVSACMAGAVYFFSKKILCQKK